MIALPIRGMEAQQTKPSRQRLSIRAGWRSVELCGERWEPFLLLQAVQRNYRNICSSSGKSFLTGSWTDCQLFRDYGLYPSWFKNHRPEQFILNDCWEWLFSLYFNCRVFVCRIVFDTHMRCGQITVELDNGILHRRVQIILPIR